ncbi:hypothetical protein BJV74DRAFT_798641 [Russula compacta]|nr:hypothetical protein BJV74DRAFT_798641 [Russula compacta]
MATQHMNNPHASLSPLLLPSLTHKCNNFKTWTLPSGSSKDIIWVEEKVKDESESVQRLRVKRGEVANPMHCTTMSLDKYRSHHRQIKADPIRSLNSSNPRHKAICSGKHKVGAAVAATSRAIISDKKKTAHKKSISPGMIARLVEGVVVTNDGLRDNPLEYIHLSLPSSLGKVIMHCQAAANILQALVASGYEAETTAMVEGGVQLLLLGVTSTNPLIDIVKFFSKHVYPDLAAGKKVHPMLWGQYAAIMIERVLVIKKGMQLLFSQVDIHDISPALLNAILAKIESVGVWRKLLRMII